MQAFTLAAALFTVSVSAVQLEGTWSDWGDWDDLFSQPDDEPAGPTEVGDRSWPENNCCRHYQSDKFNDADWDDGENEWEDFCLEDVSWTEYEFAPNTHWHNDMESWKCGRDVIAQWCDTKASYLDNSCRTKGVGESAHGWAESQDTGMEN